MYFYTYYFFACVAFPRPAMSTMIQFIANYDDLFTDKGHQFKFYYDKCRNGYMSRFQPNTIGMGGEGCCRRPAAYLGASTGRRTWPTTSSGLSARPTTRPWNRPWPARTTSSNTRAAATGCAPTCARTPARAFAKTMPRQAGGVAGAAGPGHQRVNPHQNPRAGLHQKPGFP